MFKPKIITTFDKLMIVGYYKYSVISQRNNLYFQD